MTRLLATFRYDVIQQYRNGFHLVSVAVVAIAVGLWRLAGGTAAGPGLGYALAGLLVGALLITTFYFMGALVLLEKAEGVLSSLVVTPLRAGEYLAAKVASLVLLAAAENLALVVFLYGPGFRPLPLVAGLLLLGAVYTLFGFVAIARHDAINTFLMPSAGVVILLQLPLLDYFGLWRSALFYLHPVQPALVLLRAAFAPLPPGQVAYGVVGLLVWLGVSALWARRTFHRFAVRTAGG